MQRYQLTFFNNHSFVLIVLRKTIFDVISSNLSHITSTSDETEVIFHTSTHHSSTNYRKNQFTFLRLNPLTWKEELIVSTWKNYYEAKIGWYKCKCWICAYLCLACNGGLAIFSFFPFLPTFLSFLSPFLSSFFSFSSLFS